jgi:hypothetical protein
MRLIDPKMSIDTIKSYIEVWDCKGCLPYGETQHNVMAVDDLQYFPTIEAEPVRHGRWIRRETVLDTECKCSVCGYKDFVPKHDNYWFRRKFCPNCGARMDEPPEKE